MSLLLRHLESHGLVSPGDLEVAARRQQNAGGSLDTALLELGLLTPTQLDEALCEACGLPGAPVRLLERGPQRPWDAVPKDLVDIGWAIPLATEAGQTIVAVHPDLPDAKLGQLYRQIRGFYPVVAPECCLAKVAAERSGAILSPRYALVVLDYLQGLRRRESGRDDDADAPAEVAVLRPGRPAVPSDTNPVRPASGRQPAARPLQPEPPRPLRPEPVAVPDEAPEAAPTKAPEVAPTKAPEVAPAAAPEVAPAAAPVTPAPAAPRTPAPTPVLKDKPEPTRTSPLEPTRRRSGPTPAAPTVVLPLAQRLTAARAALAGARERDRITEALVRAAAIIAPRVGLFGVKREGLRVLAAPGSALRLTEGLVIPLPEGGLLDRAVMGHEPFTLLTEPSLSFAVGQPLGIPCVFERVVASGRTVLMLYLDRAGVAFDPAERAATRDLCETARQSLESLLRLLGWNIPVASAGSDAARAPARPPALNLPLRPVTPPPIPDTPGAGVLPASEPGRIVVPSEPARSPFTSTIVARTPSEMVGPLGAPTEASESPGPGPAAPGPAAPPREPAAPVVERPRGPVRPIRARAVITLTNPIRRDDVGAPTPAPSIPPATAGEAFGPDSPLVARFAAFAATDDPKEDAPRTARPASEAPAEIRAEAPETRATEAERAATPAAGPSPAATEPDVASAAARAAEELFEAAGAALDALDAVDGPVLQDREAGEATAGEATARASEASVPVTSPEAGAASRSEAAEAAPVLDAGEASGAVESGVADGSVAAAGAAEAAPRGAAEAGAEASEASAAVETSRGDADAAASASEAVETSRGDAETSEAIEAIEAPRGAADAAASASEASAAVETGDADAAASAAVETSDADAAASASAASEAVEAGDAAAAEAAAAVEAGGPASPAPDESASTLNMPNLIAPPGATGAPRRRRKPDPVLVIPATLRRPTSMSASPHPMGRRERAGEETAPAAPSPTLSIPATLVHPRAGRRRGKNDPRPEVVALTMPRLVRPREEEPAPAVTSGEGPVVEDLAQRTEAPPAASAEVAPSPQAAEPAAPAAPAPESDAPTPAPESGAPEVSGPHEPSAATAAAEPEDPIEAYLREPDEPARLEALRQLDAEGLARLAARFPGPIDLASAAGSPAPSAHGVLLRACVALGPSVAPTIVALLASPRPQIRFYAAFLFQELRDPRCCSALGELAFDTDPDVRLIATRVLESYAREPELAGVVPKIRAELDSSERARQVLAAEAVGTLRDTAAVPRLIDLLAFREKELREAALEALCSITAKHYGYRSARWRAWHEEHGHESRIEWVIDGLRHRDAAVRRWAADELVRVTNQRIVFPVEGDKKAREIALRQWLDWWDAHRDEFTVRR